MAAIGGGQGTLAGPILGAMLFTLIPEWLRVFGDARMAIYALVVIFIVIFMPKGILFYATQLFKLSSPSPLPLPPGERENIKK